MATSTGQNLYRYNEELCFIVKQPLLSGWDDGGPDTRKVTFVCPKHRAPLVKIENSMKGFPGFKLNCPFCERDKEYEPLRFNGQQYEDLQKKALSLLDSRDLKNARLIRLDDVYVPEIVKFDALKNEKSDYFLKADVKTDIDGDTIVIIYVGNKNEKNKSQFFIKPEKLQLSHDFKDLDPAKILAKIELTLKDRTIAQEYDDDQKEEERLDGND